MNGTGCHGTNARGEPCGMAPLEGRDFCWAHDPENRGKAAAARRQGGANRRRSKTAPEDAPRLRDVDSVQSILEQAVADTLALENSVQRNRTVAYLATCLLSALEKGEFEQRLAELEGRLQTPEGKVA
jgi:hypothetical protein